MYIHKCHVWMVKSHTLADLTYDQFKSPLKSSNTSNTWIDEEKQIKSCKLR